MVAAVLAAALCAAVQAAQGPDDLQAKIDRAARLNVTAPREESEKLLDELSSELDRATPRQRDRITLLRARNKALAGDYQDAIDLLQPLRDGDADPDLKLSAFRLSATSAVNRDHFEEGFRYLRRGLELVPEVDAPEPTTKLLSLAAYAYGQAGEARKGIEYANQALELARDSGEPRLVCIALNDLGQARSRAGDPKAAVDAERQALNACRDSGDPVMTGVVAGALGGMLLDAGKTGDAIPLLRSSIEQLQTAGFPDGVLDKQLHLARALVESGKPGQAEEILTGLVKRLEAVKAWNNLREAHQLLARILKAGGDYPAALSHQEAADRAGQNFIDRERAMRLAYLQVDFDTRRKEQQIELLREQNRVLELQDRNQRQQRYLFAGGIAALSVIGVLLSVVLFKTRTDRRRLLRISQRDSLTGLFNHTNFFRRAGNALEDSRNNGRPFTLLLADVDHFKRINDLNGHAAGDDALREIANGFRSAFGERGIAGRIGGEEFSAALPGVDSRGARELAEKFNAALWRAAEKGGVMQMTVSFGIVQADGELTLEQLRQAADDALYEAKRRGRNQLVDAVELVSGQASP